MAHKKPTANKIYKFCNAVVSMDTIMAFKMQKEKIRIWHKGNMIIHIDGYREEFDDFRKKFLKIYHWNKDNRKIHWLMVIDNTVINMHFIASMQFKDNSVYFRFKGNSYMQVSTDKIMFDVFYQRYKNWVESTDDNFKQEIIKSNALRERNKISKLGIGIYNKGIK